MQILDGEPLSNPAAIEQHNAMPPDERPAWFATGRVTVHRCGVRANNGSIRVMYAGRLRGIAIGSPLLSGGMVVLWDTEEQARRVAESYRAQCRAESNYNGR